MSSVVMHHDSQVESATAGVSVLFVLGIVALIAMLSQGQEFSNFMHHGATSQQTIDPNADPRAHARQARQEQLELRFEQAVVMLHAKQYEHAITALHRVIELSPRMPEAHVNMGYALLGLENHAAARDFFNTAIELQPFQANAYWGLAVSSEALGDLEVALGAMRAYLHLTPPSPESEEYLRKARAALWEWETALGRGPLPPEEAEWLQRRGQEWTDRNTPAQDRPAPAQRIIEFPSPKPAQPQ